MASVTLPTIQMFWHGPPLSRVERLSLASFVAHGHPVELYVYEAPEGVPAGVRLQNAHQVLPRSAMFHHRRTGSLAPFSDWFRYRLLNLRGGIWADLDMVCLAPLDYAQTEVFGWQDDNLINNAVLGLPAGHPLAQWMEEVSEHPNRWLPYDKLDFRLRKLKRRWFQGNKRANTGWGESGPKGLTRAARHLGYLERALPEKEFYPVAFEASRSLFESPATGAPDPLAGSRAVHLWNYTVDKELGLDKNARFPVDSLFEQLCGRYGV